MKDASYAADNLRVIKENIYAFASYAPAWPNGELFDKVEEIENKIDELIKLIEK